MTKKDESDTCIYFLLLLLL